MQGTRSARTRLKGLNPFNPTLDRRAWGR